MGAMPLKWTSSTVESLAELILSVEPEGDRAKLMADALAHFGHVYLERDGEGETGPHGAH